MRVSLTCLPRILGIHNVDGSWTVSDFYPVIALAIIVLVTLLIAGVLVYLRRIIIGPRISFRKCDHCGYDLTGNTSGRCPECGTPIGGSRGESLADSSQVKE